MAAIPPDSLTTLANVKIALGVADETEDALLGQLVNQVSALVLDSIHRPFVLASNPANPVTEYYAGPGDEWLLLDNWPVRAPVLAGDTTQGSAVVADLPNTNYLFVNQSVTGPGVPTGAYVAAVGANQVTLSQPATATAAAVPLLFGVAVWEDETGAWGSGGAGGAPAFGESARLQEGADFALRRDRPDGSGKSALLCRLNGVWGALWQRPEVALSAYRVPGRGNIKVQYWAGYAGLPADLEMACVRAVARARNSRLYGQALNSESADGASYALANTPDVRYGLLSGEVGSILAKYRRLRQGQDL